MEMTKAADAGVATGEPPNAEQATGALLRLSAAMRGLSVLDRQIVLAHRLGDASYSDIAAETGLSPLQIERRMGRIIARIGRAFSVTDDHRDGQA